MPIDLPPEVPKPVISAPAPIVPECRYLSNAEAQEAFRRLKRTLPGTSFEGAAPSEVCGLARVKLTRGTVAYTDATGRYFILALALDTHKGSPADQSEAIERIIDHREKPPPGMTE